MKKLITTCCWLICLFFSCTDKNNKTIIKFSADRTTIVIKGFDEATALKIKELKTDSLAAANLIKVVYLPDNEDQDQNQKIIGGNLTLSGDSLIFKPQQAFIKNKSYLVQSFIDVQFANFEKMFKQSIKPNLKPQQQVLKR